MAVNPYALSFDGSNDYVDFGSPAVLNITGDLTLEFWIKVDDLSAARAVISWINDSAGFPFHVVLLTDGTIRFNRSESGSGQAFDSDSGEVTTGSWLHIACTHDTAANQAVIYVDGASVKSGAHTVNVDSGDGFLSLSRRDGQYFDGIIDEVRVWNVVRTQTQIQDNMRAALDGDETGLAGYWKLDEGSGSTTADSTANSNDGTINGASWTTDTAPLWNFLEETDSLILALAEADELYNVITDTDALILALQEQHTKWYRDLNSARFMRIQPDSTTVEIHKDVTTMKVLHDGETSV